MIALCNVTRYTWNGYESVAVLDDESSFFGLKQRIGILAAPGSGKTTIARLLSGIEKPNRGDILFEGTVSWPLGFAGFLHPELTGEMNISLIAKTIGEDPVELLAFCSDITRQQDGFRNKVKNYSPTVRASLAFALSLARQCDFYIADEKIGVGDGAERDRYSAMLDNRLENAGLVFISRSARYLERSCSRFFVLHRSRLIEVDSAKTAEAVQQLTIKTR